MKTFEIKLGAKTYLMRSKSEHALRKRLGKVFWQMGAKVKEVKF